MALQISAADVARMETEIKTSIYSNAMNMRSHDISASGIYILHSNGELWAYIARNVSSATESVLGLALTDVISISSTRGFV